MKRSVVLTAYNVAQMQWDDKVPVAPISLGIVLSYRTPSPQLS